MFKLLVITVTNSMNGAGVANTIVEFDTKFKADRAFDNIIEESCGIARVTAIKLY